MWYVAFLLSLLVDAAMWNSSDVNVVFGCASITLCLGCMTAIKLRRDIATHLRNERSWTTHIKPSEITASAGSDYVEPYASAGYPGTIEEANTCTVWEQVRQDSSNPYVRYGIFDGQRSDLRNEHVRWAIDELSNSQMTRDELDQRFEALYWSTVNMHADGSAADVLKEIDEARDQAWLGGE